MIFGKKIKELREEHGMVQRKLAAALDIDTPMYSKIERGERKAKRCHIPIMAKLLEIDEKELLTIWLADKVLDTVEGEDEVKRDAVIFAQERDRGWSWMISTFCCTFVTLNFINPLHRLYTKKSCKFFQSYKKSRAEQNNSIYFLC